MRKLTAITATSLCLTAATIQPANASGIPTLDVIGAQATNISRMFISMINSKLADGSIKADSELAKRQEQATTVRAAVNSVEGCYTSTGALALSAANKLASMVAVSAEDWMLSQARDGFKDEPYGYAQRVYDREDDLKDKDLRPVDLVHEQSSLTDEEIRVALEGLSASTSPRNADFGDVDEDMEARLRKIRHAWITAPAVVALSQQAEAVDADAWRETIAAMGNFAADAFSNSDKVSQMEILDFFVNARYGGAGYFSETLPSMVSEPELLREIARVSAFNLRVNYESLKLQRMQVMAEAVANSGEFTEQFDVQSVSE